jgi:hypothetical protein
VTAGGGHAGVADVVLLAVAVGCFLVFGFVREEVVRGPEENYDRLTVGLPVSPWYEKVTDRGPTKFGFRMTMNVACWSSLFLIAGVVSLRVRFGLNRSPVRPPTESPS